MATHSSIISWRIPWIEVLGRLQSMGSYRVEHELSNLAHVCIPWNDKCPLPVLWPLLSFPNLLAYFCSTLTASSFKIWNSSAEIPSPPLALFIVILPKAHLTSHSRMSGSRWVITLSCLSVSLRLFFWYSFCVYSFQLFIISSTSVSSCCFCHLLCPSLHEMFPWCLQFSRRDL